MNGCMKSASLLILLASVSRAAADEEMSTWQTKASRDGVNIAEQRQDLNLARQIISECERIVQAMKQYEAEGHVKKGDQWQAFVQEHQPSIFQLIRDGRRLKKNGVRSAGQLPEVTNVVMIALGYDNANAFDTMLRIYEQDRDAASIGVQECERRLPRKWRNRKGTQTVVAELVSRDSNKVVLRRLDNGRQVTVVIDKLSQVDRRFLDRLAEVSRNQGRPMLKEIGIERRSMPQDAE